MSNQQGVGPTRASTLTETDIEHVRPLRCPACGNAGESMFSSATSVFIDGRSGIPWLVLDYAERWTSVPEEPLISCHGCNHGGRLSEFDAAALR